MTRYTKLDKRKPEYIKDKTRESSPESDDESVASSSKKKVEDVPSKIEAEGKVANVQKGAKKEISEPAKLLKRVKLLKLKAKKSKDDSRKRELAMQIREMEQRVNVLNGERGARRRGNINQGGIGGNPIPAGVNPWKAMEAERRKVADVRSSIRREKREHERTSNTLCYACRQVGHAAKDCTSSVVLDTPSREDRVAQSIVCCYRCGSTEHSLAKCKRPEPKVGPDLPFATCFICGEKGHLASKCKLNKGRGIYPNGGCCKLCQSVDHLAKDCHLRSNAAGVNSIPNAAITMGGQDGITGADEDDFHSLSRKRRAIELEEKQTEVPSKKKRRDVQKTIRF